MKKVIGVLISFIFVIGSWAGEREENVQALMEAQGLLEMFESQMELGKVQSEKMGRQMMDQMLTQLNPSEKFKEMFEASFSKLIAKLQTPWTAEDIVAVWAEHYGKHFSDDELEKLLVFYTSPIGKKEIFASKSAMPEFSMHFQRLSGPLMQSAMQEYIDDLKSVVEECDCQKAPVITN